MRFHNNLQTHENHAVYNIGHGEKTHQNKNPLSQERETNKIRINWKLIERKTRIQTRNGKRKSGLSTGENQWKPSQECLMEARV